MNVYLSVLDNAMILKGWLGIVLQISIAVFFISVLLYFLLQRKFNVKYSKHDVLSEEGLLILISKGENDKVEFKSTVRMNLHSNKMGKETELAWLKSVVAFFNTNGGRLLIGVGDNGDIIGLDKDSFANDDIILMHIQKLIDQHIGVEFSKFIDYSLRSINGVTVLVIQCNPCSKPVFLKFNEKEQFFVRIGPASIELPVSKVLEYMKERKNELNEMS
jgi:predicted HTH transcriptional regulator